MGSNHGGRVCVEASPVVHRQAGLGRYATGLIQGLLTHDPDGDYAIAYNEPKHSRLRAPLSKLPRYTSSLGHKPWRIRNALTYFGAPPMEMSLPGVSIYHSTGHLLPRLRRIRTVFTLHDLIPLLFPEYHLPMNRIFLRLMMPRFLDEADAIIAVSENTRQDAADLLGIEPTRVTVISEGVDPHFHPVTDPIKLDAVRAAYGLPQRFILYVSTIEPRKNHGMLLEAYAALRKKDSDVRLVLVGELGWLWQDFLGDVERSGFGREVSLIGYVPDADLPALISAATVFACPSLYEGFGLPALEAMACGTAVVCSDAASLPEVVGQAGILCDPNDVEAWQHSLSVVLEDEELRSDLEARGKERAASFTWEEVARATRGVYDLVLGI